MDGTTSAPHLRGPPTLAIPDLPHGSLGLAGRPTLSPLRQLAQGPYIRYHGRIGQRRGFEGLLDILIVNPRTPYIPTFLDPKPTK